MSNTIAYVDNQTLTNIADAVRDKTGTDGKMLLSDIPDTIRNLDTSDITALNTRVTAVEDALAFKANSAEIGDLSQLTTTAKDNLVSAINEAAQTAETGATASAQTATTKASEATASAQSAASSAQTATDKATLATNKAQAASESASIANEAKSAAIGNAQMAVTKADEARNSATAAANSATSAQKYDESAQQSAVNAQTAQGLAEQAQTAAETAQGLAEDARDEAQQIKDDVEDAIAGKADSAEIGDLSQLTTTAKDNLVSAINEADADVEQLKADLDDLNSNLSDITGITEIVFTHRKYVNTAGSTVTMSDGVPVMESTNNFKCAVLQCGEGDTFTVSGTGGSSAQLWTFIDSVGKILYKSGNSATATNLILVAPVNSAWLILHNATADAVTSYVGSAPLSQLYDSVDSINDKLYVNYNLSPFEKGTINVASGIENVNSTRVRTNGYINIDDIIGITLNTSAKYSLRYYNAQKEYISGDNAFRTNSLTSVEMKYIGMPATCKYIRIVAGYANDEPITNVNAFNALVSITVKALKPDIFDACLFNSDAINLAFEHGNINYQTGEENWNTETRIKSHVYIPVDEIISISLTDAYISFRYYDADKNFISGMSTWVSSVTDQLTNAPDGCKYIRICARNSANNTITDILALSKKIIVTAKSNIVRGIEQRLEFTSTNKIHKGNVGNMSIVCAKEHTNNSGNFPVIEWYLLEEAGGTNRFYISKDLQNVDFAFSFIGDSYKYSFGVLANGDIVAVLDASAISWYDNGNVERSESFRVNPYVFLASENWEVQHEVIFSDDIKPMGWLSNYGFRVLPDGTALFAEYTRYCVLTANIWKIDGDPTNASNWTIVKQLELPDPGQNLLKHWHTVQYDPFTGIVYAATGDSNPGSMCFYSTDNGNTWTQLGTYSSKYFRFLNLIFTDDTIYWAKDWYDASEHYLFKCGRDANGVLDIANVVDYIAIPEVENLSTYTTCYMPEIDAILLLEREDSGGGTNSPAPIRLCDIANGTLHTIAYMKSAKGIREQIGFRTRYSEVYPNKCVVNLGWALKRQLNANATNLLDWYDNEGNDDNPWTYGLTNVNNLTLEVYKNSTGYHLKVSTRLI